MFARDRDRFGDSLARVDVLPLGSGAVGETDRFCFTKRAHVHLGDETRNIPEQRNQGVSNLGSVDHRWRPPNHFSTTIRFTPS